MSKECEYEPKFAKIGKKKPKHKTKEEKAHLNWVASQGCMIPECQDSPNVHHIRLNGEPRDHFKTIPLCYNHHQGPEGIHYLGKHIWRGKYGHEMVMHIDLMQRLDR